MYIPEVIYLPENWGDRVSMSFAEPPTLAEMAKMESMNESVPIEHAEYVLVGYHPSHVWTDFNWKHEVDVKIAPAWEYRRK